ncbi:hypothetical protein T4A_10030 [Trichinella pseudospiralis]|uniref:Uncharacterized protein n=1 Tax=Trichinella pseudospiralis TaxID=6337 RepID=A0A0V1EHS5_TRIPS|nr:hypothetical protein T4A_10030 [Trichinella pseudospiralis]
MFTDCRTGKSRPRALFILLNSSNNSNSGSGSSLYAVQFSSVRLAPIENLAVLLTNKFQKVYVRAN